MRKKPLKITFSQKFKGWLNVAVPLWLVFVLILNSSMLIGFIEYYLMRKNLNQQISQLSKTTKSPEELIQILKQEVLPQQGYTLGVRWNDIYKSMLETGVIDEKKYKDLFASDDEALQHMERLNKQSFSSNKQSFSSNKNQGKNMTINEKNARFMVNTLWAFGLVNKSKILDKGSMKKYAGGNYMNFASTGGWNLGSKPTAELYSSSEIIKLTPEQEALVEKIAKNVYRPCCGNSTEFPDCNHGMAALGYIELAVSQGLSEGRIYKDLLALNSFWFPQNYVELAAYMDKQGVKWSKVNAQEALSAPYSSAQGAQRIRQSVQNVPGLNIQGGGCGA